MVDGKQRAGRDQGQAHLHEHVPSDSLPLMKLQLSKISTTFHTGITVWEQVFNTLGTYISQLNQNCNIGGQYSPGYVKEMELLSMVKNETVIRYENSIIKVSNCNSDKHEPT